MIKYNCICIIFHSAAQSGVDPTAAKDPQTLRGPSKEGLGRRTRRFYARKEELRYGCLADVSA